MKGKMPIQTKANGLSLDKVPQELSDLNSLELRLISMCILFMKMIPLPCGQQRCIDGNAKSNSYEGSSEIAQGYKRLNDLATERGFIIQDIPADGDCLFSVISVQLQNVGIQQIVSRDLRSAVAQYMEQNPTITSELYYRNFVSSAVSNDYSNFMNVDTEAPAEEVLYQQ